MAALPEPVHTTVNMIYTAYENDADDGNRPHLGASLIGHACERYLWMTFRWVDSKKFPGRMLRLFETGSLAEARFVANLKRIGVEVHDTTPDGKQWRVSALGGHFAGSMDGAGRGFPEAPKTWAVIEFKTHGEKSFTELVKKKVQAAKPQHYAQMQVYMGETGMERAMYLAVNKNTDELYAEWVHFDPVEYAKLKARAERVIRAAEPPLRVSNDPSWFVCKFCDFHEICHGNKPPKATCRTCCHSTAELDGEARWSCAHHNADIPTDAQRAGCDQHRFIPVLLERAGAVVEVKDSEVVYESGLINGSGAGACSSVEIATMGDITMGGEVCKLKAELAEQFIDSKVVA